jgi:hypothetical protein
MDPRRNHRWNPTNSIGCPSCTASALFEDWKDAKNYRMDEKALQFVIDSFLLRKRKLFKKIARFW